VFIASRPSVSRVPQVLLVLSLQVRSQTDAGPSSATSPAHIGAVGRGHAASLRSTKLGARALDG
jgi:hypothetical protein